MFVFAGALLLFEQAGGSWWTFLLLFLLPDLSMLGYLAGKSVGATIYNAAHSYATPAILFISGQFLPWIDPNLAVIWAAHIALDRALGFGLKASTGFRHTHLGFVGKPNE